MAVGVVFLAHSDGRFRNGGIGVDIFFALSGFLITSILVRDCERSAGLRYRRFLARRILRLMPALVVVLIFCVASSYVLHGDIDQQTRRGAVSALFYLSNWYRATGHHAGLVAHTWSLGIEEQFYVIWPVILAAAYRWRGRRGVMFAAITLALASTATRAALSIAHASYYRVYDGTDTEADQLLWGCALAVAVVEFPLVIKAVARLAPLALAGLVALAFCQAPFSFFAEGGLTVVALCSVVVIASLAEVHTGLLYRGFTLRPMVWVGRISYGVYLWHYPLILLVRDKSQSVAVVIVIAGVLSLIAAASSFKLVETPVLEWRSRVASDAVEEPGVLTLVGMSDDVQASRSVTE